MRIKKLELIGFKSFKDRTVIHFDQGITGIVGPNGCGKSNIVDALVWVMGEMSAKHLRGSSMEDVIFSGADGYAPMGLAEVSLTLENDGGPFPAKYMKYSEIMVTRRLHRSGDSEYLINKEPARLRDVQEIFMDTGAGSKGFSIIEQGAIGRIVTAKPEDRRTLIEEAAGITKFKVRKRESQKKLVSTEQNLIRLQDIMAEQKRQLDSLERQAQRAEKYRVLKDEIRQKDLLLSKVKYNDLSTRKQNLMTQVWESEEKEVGITTEISQYDSQSQSLRLQTAELESQVQQAQTSNQQVQNEVQSKEMELRELQFQTEQEKRNSEMTGQIADQYRSRVTVLEKDNVNLRERLDIVSVTGVNLEQEFNEKSAQYKTVQERIQFLDNELTDKRRQMLTLSQTESHLDARLNSLETQISEMSERLQSGRENLAELELKAGEFDRRKKKVTDQLESEKQLQLDIVKDVENLQENLNLLKEKLETKRNETSEFKEELNKVSSRLYGLENLHQNFEGFQEGVKTVMVWQKSHQEIHADGSVSVSKRYSPLTEVLQVPPEYEFALEAGLGQQMQVLVSENFQTSVEALDYLKSQNHGRSSFLPADFMGEDLASEAFRQSIKEVPGVVSHFLDFVKPEAGFEKEIGFLLKDYVLVEDLVTAWNLRSKYPECTFVTKEGESLSPEGIITGGSKEQVESGVLKRKREIRELQSLKDELSGKLALAQVSLSKLEEQFEDLSVNLEKTKTAQNEKEILLMTLKKDIERVEMENNNAKDAVTRAQNEVSREEGILLQRQATAADLRSNLESNRTQKREIEVLVEKADIELQESKSGVGDLGERVTKLQVDLASRRQEEEGIRSQLNLVESSLKEVTSQLEQMSAETKRSTDSASAHLLRMEELKHELEKSILRAEESRTELARLRNSYEEQAAQVREFDKKNSELSSQLYSLKNKLSEARIELEQVKIKEQYIVDQVYERYMQQISDVSVDVPEQFDAQACEVDLADLKSKANRMGEVNLTSIQEYDELSQRHGFLVTQHNDLTEAKEQLRKVIDRITRICSKRFKETFELVNDRFTKVFPTLFGGGEARLILVEDIEAGEMGIDIIAKPPGKKSQNVTLLSGGEKALTAVSLIFSIFLVKPSPYCLLDEVDAPLDDANVLRFNELVKEMAKRSQIIIVTHNKHTMKVNNRLYGVTMEEKGVSKMVSVNLEQAQQVVG